MFKILLLSLLLLSANSYAESLPSKFTPAAKVNCANVKSEIVRTFQVLEKWNNVHAVVYNDLDVNINQWYSELNSLVGTNLTGRYFPSGHFDNIGEIGDNVTGLKNFYDSQKSVLNNYINKLTKTLGSCK